jgi:hypothetical protein
MLARIPRPALIAPAPLPLNLGRPFNQPLQLQEPHPTKENDRSNPRRPSAGAAVQHHAQVQRLA